MRRSANPADRRSLVVEITPAGPTVAQELRTIVHRHEKARISSLSDADLRNFIEQMYRSQDGLAPDPCSRRLTEPWPAATQRSPRAGRLRRRPLRSEPVTCLTESVARW